MLGIRRAVNKPMKACFEQISRSGSTGSYTLDRAKYKNQLTEMRKSWLDEFARRKELKEQQDREERRIIVENKAVTIRARKAITDANIAEHMKWVAKDQLRKRTYQAKQHFLFEKRCEKQNERFGRVADDLTYESQTWITRDNMASKITADLFNDANPTTTGLATKYSNHWRYQVESSDYQMEQAFRPEQFTVRKTEREKEEHRIAEHKFRHRESVEEFLSGMVGSGEELLKLKDLVDDMVGDTLENKGGFRDDWQKNHDLFDRTEKRVHDINLAAADSDDSDAEYYSTDVESDGDANSDDEEYTDLEDFEGGEGSDSEGEEVQVTYRGKTQEEYLDHTDLDYEEERLMKQEAKALALNAGEDSYKCNEQVYYISKEEIRDYEEGLKMIALMAGESTYVIRDKKHLISAEDKAAFEEAEMEKRLEAKAAAFFDGEDSYEYRGEVYAIDPEEVAQARELMAAKKAALSAGQDSFVFQGETHELDEDDHEEFAVEAELEARHTALKAGQASYTYDGATHEFSAEEKEEFKEEEAWVEKQLLKREAEFVEELAQLVEMGELTEAQMQSEVKANEAKRDLNRKRLRRELEERSEALMSEKWQKELGL